MKTRILISLAVAALAAALLAGCGASGTKDEGSASAATAANEALLAGTDVATVSRTDLAAGVPVSGTLTPGWQARVTSPLDEVVEEVLVREGERVTRGQVLARFRSGTASAGAASARAQLKSAQADFERNQNLLREGAVSPRDLESAEAAYRAAQANEAEAARRLDDATVRAPGAGTVTTRSAQTGDRVSSGDPLFVVSDTRELEFEATVPAEFVPVIHAGDDVRLAVNGIGGTLHGRVARINSTADPATRQVKVYVRVPNGAGRLVGGLFASGSVVTHHVRSSLAVPAAAIHGDPGAAWTMVIANGHLARVNVQPGVRDEARDLVEVRGGLHEGDIVVTGALEGLTEGQAVRVTGKAR